MEVHNTVPYFLENYEPSEEFLDYYHQKFSRHFEQYFLLHCKNPSEKKSRAIEKYPMKLADIEESNRKIEMLIKQVAENYEVKYQVQFTKDVHIIVGCYGSNAFTHRQYIPEISFCLERLSSNTEHLQVIIAHEFGHALHNILSDQEGMNWPELDWDNPYIWLLQEGCATYFSKQVVEAEQSVYFSYNDEGEEWLNFAKAHRQTIIKSFLEDVDRLSQKEIFNEWFSINGGEKFGHTRLAYFIGYEMLQQLMDQHGELKAVTLWSKPSFNQEAENALTKLMDA